LGYLQKQAASQSLQEEGEKSFDRITCTDGTELWFDITDGTHKLRAEIEVAAGHMH